MNETTQEKSDKAIALTEGLAQFNGTQNYTRHIGGLLLTDGVVYLAEEAGAWWLLDLIASYQPQIRKAATEDPRLRDMQFWKLELDGLGGCTIHCEADRDEPPVVSQAIEWTTFPLQSLALYAQTSYEPNGIVVMLPGEY